MSLLMTVERHLRRAAVPPSRFGRDVAGDPRFVFDLRRGREPRAATRERVLAFIAKAQSASQSAAQAGMKADSSNGASAHNNHEVV